MSRHFFVPNSTQIPDVYLDVWLAKLTAVEFKVLMYICRRTYGFRKETDIISVPQIASGIVRKDGTRLDSGTGLGETAVKSSLGNLEKYGLIQKVVRKREDGSFLPSAYTVLIPDEEGGVGRHATGMGRETTEGVGRHTTPQYTVVQNTDNNKTVTVYSPLQGEELVPKSTIIEPLPVGRKVNLGRDTQERERCIEELYKAYREVYNQIPVEVEIHRPAYEKVKTQMSALHTDCKATPDQVRKALKKLLSTKDKKYITAKVLVEEWQALAHTFTTAKNPTTPRSAAPPSSQRPTFTPPTMTKEALRDTLRQDWEQSLSLRHQRARTGHFNSAAENVAYYKLSEPEKTEARERGYVLGFEPDFDKEMGWCNE